MPETASLEAALSQSAASWSIALGAAESEAIERYANLLLTWTTRINLTGAVSVEDLAAEHLPDSFVLASRLTAQELGTDTARVIDVGSGGGLPALPLAILCPHLRIQLIEPIAKKAAFLRTAIRELKLGERMTVVGKRAETFVPADFDVAISRATLPPPAWMALGAQLVRPGGRVFVLASSKAEVTPIPASLTEDGTWSYLDGRRTLLELRRSTG
jgi:16S rRNA (guanine527-N7)-methyltransferase